MDSKIKFLNESAIKFDTAKDFDAVMAYYDIKNISQWFLGDVILELGSNSGTVTRYLKDKASSLDVVEGSHVAIERSKDNLGEWGLRDEKIRFIEDLWENYFPTDKKYTDIVFIRGLEHLDDQERVPVLRHLQGLVVNKGRIHIIVPNARSLHRQIMVAKGTLSDIYALRDRDHDVGHKIIYDLETLKEEVAAAGWSIIHQESFFVKQTGTSDFGDITMDPEHPLVKASYEASKFAPNLGTQLYVVAEEKT